MKSKYNNIYVLAPYNYATGGVELAHQLVDYLRNNNQNAYIVYMIGKDISDRQDITQAYSKYNIKSTAIIEDTLNNILILPEIYFEKILIYKNIQIGCWWMSVDNHYKNSEFCLYDKIINEKNIIKKLKILFKHLFCKENKSKYSDRVLKKEEKRITHFYQSHYAQYHLYSKGYSKIMPLSDYINIDLQGNHTLIKENIILYNPVKGYEFTKQIIKQLPNYNFIPLKGYTREQLKELFLKSKLYIDFGHFPGKDRLFREAAINGCCIMTGKLGASYFYEDVPIKEDYKFETTNKNIKNICNKISYIINNYETCFKEFDYLRYKTKQEMNIFHNEIDIFFIN